MDFAICRKAVPVATLLVLAGCASTTAAPPARPAERAVERPVSYNSTGLEAVLGRTAPMLEAQLGKPRLDVREGTARKLQFSGPACVLDAYLYPPKGSGEPIVTHLDARRPDGTDFDRASCVAALTRR
ncbi:MAG TPA: hypothetical protein VD846_11270 [Allosphingosinicella sp.]|nr:hypothetical protein [Allosphingosinicella sp.]